MFPSISAVPETEEVNDVTAALRERQRETKARRAQETKLRCEAIERGFGLFKAPLEDAAAEHAIYVEETVVSFERREALLQNKLTEERARREQISVSFLSLLKDSLIELREHAGKERSSTLERLEERFERTAERLRELQERIPREREELLEDITAQTTALQEKVDHFLTVEVGGENASCKQRLQAIADDIGTASMGVDNNMTVARNHRETNVDELKAMLAESAKVAHKNINRLRSNFEYDIASIKNSLTNEAIVREASDRELAAMMTRQVQTLMASLQMVNSTIGIDDRFDDPNATTALVSTMAADSTHGAVVSFDSCTTSKERTMQNVGDTTTRDAVEVGRSGRR